MDLNRLMRMLLSPPALMLLLFLPAAIAWRHLDPHAHPPFLIYGLRWFLGLLFLISGLAKLVPGFPNTMGPVDLEQTLAPHGLALYARFIAVSEVGTAPMIRAGMAPYARPTPTPMIIEISTSCQSECMNMTPAP